jgi:DNA-binding PadR family transcriptional regulator
MKSEFSRLSAKEIKVLELLLSRGEMFGLEMVEASAGELKRGTIYVTLSRMAHKGYIDSREEPRGVSEGGLPRRIYSVTGLGEMIFNANLRVTEIFRTLAAEAN